MHLGRTHGMPPFYTCRACHNYDYLVIKQPVDYTAPELHLISIRVHTVTGAPYATVGLFGVVATVSYSVLRTYARVGRSNWCSV